MTDVDFVAVDWGTSSFRMRALDARGEVVASDQGGFGMATLQPNEFAEVLEQRLTNAGVSDRVPVVICGMAGAAQGWHEAPYLDAPTELSALGDHAVKVPDINRDVWILPGVKQATPSNVMRGEETQIAGFLDANPFFEGVVCLPGTHTKWVDVSQGCIKEFATCMTGEMFALISSHSVLRHSLIGDGWDDDEFIRTIKSAANDPSQVAQRLFDLRAEMLLASLSGAAARARLSGWLIGQELASTAKYWRDSKVHLIGAPQLAAKYAAALEALGAAAQSENSDEMTLAGLRAAYQRIKEINP